MQPKYDQTSPQAIEAYGKRLIGGSLRSVPGVNPIEAGLVLQNSRTRGVFGHELETRYFGINPGSSSEPDFKEAGVELKTLPLKKRSKGGHQAKERLVLNIINYIEEAKKTFPTSSFMTKNRLLMLVAYLHEKGVDIRDYKVKLARLLALDELPEDERKIIEADWNKIWKKIKEGRAHELSEGDTLLLGACTKAATAANLREQANGGPRAKPRAFAFKQGYMTRIVRRELGEPSIDKDEEKVLRGDEVKRADKFESIVTGRFQPYIGKTVEEIKNAIAPELNLGAKGSLAALSRRIMGVKKQKIAEFEDAEVQMKTIQLKANGMPKEDMSFPAFRYKEIVEEKWDADEEDIGEKQAEFHKQLEKRFFFVVFQCEGDCKRGDTKRLKKVMFWAPAQSDVEEARKVWEETVKRIRANKPNELPKSTENRVAHVRPHARNAKDGNEAPDGKVYTTKCFWLNKSYLKERIERVEGPSGM